MQTAQFLITTQENHGIEVQYNEHTHKNAALTVMLECVEKGERKESCLNELTVELSEKETHSLALRLLAIADVMAENN
jgi:hypothetical protein